MEDEDTASLHAAADDDDPLPIPDGSGRVLRQRSPEKPEAGLPFAPP